MPQAFKVAQKNLSVTSDYVPNVTVGDVTGETTTSGWYYTTYTHTITIPITINNYSSDEGLYYTYNDGDKNTISSKDVNIQISVSTTSTTATSQSIKIYAGNGNYSSFTISIRGSGTNFTFTPSSVSEKKVSQSKSTFTKSEVMTGSWCQKYYYESKDKSDRGKWRIPNEKELTLMLKYTDKLTNALSTSYTCAKSKYERPNNEGTMVYYVNVANVITTDKNDNTGSTAIGDRQIFTIRCVRDATPDTSGSDETDKSSNTFESGGNVIK